MGLAGELTTIGLAEVFQNLAFNSHSGTLTLKQGDLKARICFEQGRIRALKIDGREFDFAEIARRAGAAPAEVLEQAASKNRRRTLKAYLRAAGEFNEEAYDAAVAAAVEEELLPLFGWAKASFLFEEGDVNARIYGKEQIDCNVVLDPQGVAMEAARRHDEWETVAPYAPSDTEYVVLVGPWPDELEPQVERLLKLLDGTRDLKTVLKESPLRKYEVMKTVAAYVEAGWLMVATPERLRELASQALAASQINVAARRLEVAVELDAQDLDARVELVRCYERSGRRFDAAGEQIRVADLQAERGDLEGAHESYERAAVLAPGNLDVLERIFEFHEARGEHALAMRAGRRLAETLVAEQMYEDALPLYKRLLAAHEGNAGLREALAICLQKLDEPKKAADQLFLIADRAYEKGEYDLALRTYRRVCSVDPGNEAASKRIREIESGAALSARRRRRRRRLFFAAAVMVGLLLLQGVREWYALGALHVAQFASTDALSRDNGDRARAAAMARYAEVCGDYPYTRCARLARETLLRLVRAEITCVTGWVEGVSKAETTIDVEFHLGRAEKMLARLDKLAFPDEVSSVWGPARHRLQSKIDRLLER